MDSKTDLQKQINGLAIIIQEDTASLDGQFL